MKPAPPISDDKRQYVVWIALMLVEAVVVWLLRGVYDRRRRADAQVPNHIEKHPRSVL